MKNKRGISVKVLHTELSMAIQLIEEANYGNAKMLIQQIFDRVKEYEFKSEVKR